MKLYTILTSVAIGIAVGLLMSWPPRVSEEAPTPRPPSPIEIHFPLVKVEGPRFITDLSYLRDDNFVGEAFYHKFGVFECYMHENVMPNIRKLEEILIREGRKAVLLDCFRPHEAQHFLWARDPNPRFLANPFRSGSLHSRGLAIDIALADMDGNMLDHGNPKDAFTAESSHYFAYTPDMAEGFYNRRALRRIMAEAGFNSIRHEWWHYQVDGNWRAYPLINVCHLVECAYDQYSPINFVPR